MNGPGIVLFVVFVLVCKEGLTCNPGWKENNGKCYSIISSFHYDIRLARRYCQIYGGDLADVDSNVFSFLRTLDHYDDSNYWVNENSSLAASGTQDAQEVNGCPYLSGQALLYRDCEEKRPFICELEQNTELSCLKGWHLYGTTCYKPMPDTDTFQKAASICAIQRGSLAILDDIGKEHHVAAVILGRNTTFLVGAQVVNGTIQWMNGKQFSPSCPQCTVESSGECLGFQSSAEHPFLFSWVHLDCNSANNYLCEIQSFLRPPTTSTTLPPTTLTPLHCPHGFNWKPHARGFCFWETTYETEKLNWFQARKFCQTVGGDLATYQDAQEETLGLGGAKSHFRGLWFGLKRSADNVFSWVDGSPLNYTNWNFPEPNLNSRSKFCVMHGSYESLWELDYCGVRRWFICKAPKSRRVTIPETRDLFKKTPCNITSTSIYRGNWYLYEDHCYMARTYSIYSWHTAQNFCHDNDGELLSVHSYEETNFVISLIASNTDKDFWMGLSARGLGSSFEWSDGTPIDFVYWPDGRGNNSNAVETCVAFNALKGSWIQYHCNGLMSVICKRRINSTLELTTPEPTPPSPGYCSKNWYQFGNKCYSVLGLGQKVGFNLAATKCQKENATLVSIHSEEEQVFLLDLLLPFSSGAWIGLRRNMYGNKYEWKDNSSLDFTSWSRGFNSGSALKPCYELTGNYDGLGEWTHDNCDSAKYYICQKAKDPTLIEPSERPFECLNITGWHKLGNMCYGIFETPEVETTWMAAQRKCLEFDANLVSFESSAVGTFLKRRLTKKDNFLWTGVREYNPNTYGLVNGQPLKKSKWLTNQPRAVSSKRENCVVMNSDARWIVKHCQESHGFICEFVSDVSVESEASLPKETSFCPNSSEWIDLGGDSCYIFQHDIRKDWGNAVVYCFRHGGYLASFHSQRELSLVTQYWKSHESLDDSFVYYHIGLGHRHDGSASWVDNSPVDFTNWNPDEGRSKDCTKLSMDTGWWEITSCYYTVYPILCSAPKEKASQRETLTQESVEQDNISKKLTAGGIFGIVICLLVIVAIIGVAAYHLCPSTRMRVPLEETDSL